MDSLTSLSPLKRANWTARRLAFFSAVFLITAAAVVRLEDLLGDGGVGPIEIAILVVFTLNFSWIAGAFVTALIGFLLKVFTKNAVATAAPIALLDKGEGHPDGITAIVMPVYNEAVDDLFHGLRALRKSLQDTGSAHKFQLFLLSDTTDPEIASAEEAAVNAFNAQFAETNELLYRRRESNIGKKAGNIAEFCHSWGDSFDYMVVLDADSVMSGSAVVRLARMMDAAPQAGIVQTLPRLVGQDTLFGRLEQFGYRLCSEVMALGLAYWQGPDGNYFGHNAIIRLAAFRDHCKLPKIRGFGVLAGEIMSHDFVEAALLRRAGYEIWFVPDSRGSYEGCPSNALDHATRDRRWCQGNLQHLWLLPMPGLRPISRLHLLIGVTSYVASVWWLTLIVLGVVARMTIDTVPSYFSDGMPLFPTWPMDRSVGFFSLLMVTLFLLFMPKLLGLMVLLFEKRQARSFGQRPALLLGALLEALYSALRAPALMVFHTMFIVMTFLGKKVGWDPQCRDIRSVGLLAAVRLHLPQIFFAAALFAGTYAFAPDQLLWTVPVLAGLVLCVPLTMLTGSLWLGEATRRAGLFVIPEEAKAPKELAHLDKHAATAARSALPATAADPTTA